jgi:hypothetical protein
MELSGKALQHGDEVITPVSKSSAHGHKLMHLLRECPAIGSTGDDDRSAPTHFQQALVTQGAQSAQDRVRVDAQHRGKVLRLWDAFSGPGLTFRDCVSNLRCYLLVKVGTVASIDGLKCDRNLTRLIRLR